MARDKRVTNTNCLTTVQDGRVYSVSPAISILNTLLRNGVAISHVCGGKAVCGTCRVKIFGGAENLSPIGEAERVRLMSGRGDKGLPEGVRLACQTYARGDVKIKVLSNPQKRKK